MSERRIDPKAIIATVREMTSLEDFGGDSFREGFDYLAYDINRSRWVSEAGVQMLRGLYTFNLINRLRVTEHFRQNPELSDAPVTRPVFIAGMPRTGTTLVSYLLDQDPEARSLIKWEVMQSVPPAAPGETRTDERCVQQMERDAVMLAADPGSAARHYEAADGPTECTFLHAQDFKSCMLESLTPAPTYGDWLLNCDVTSTYLYQKRVLQLLQSTNPGRWTLKMPSHALFVRDLFKVFPDAQVIWTHRDPYAALASVLSLIGYHHPMTSNTIDTAYLGEHYPRQMAAHLGHILQATRERPSSIHHVYYEDLTTDTIGTMRKLYDALGLTLSARIEARMRQYLADNPQGKFGKHAYSLEEWGLTKEGLRPYFAEYLRAHPVAH